MKLGSTAQDVRVHMTDLNREMAVKPTLLGAVETIGRYMAGGAMIGGAVSEFQTMIQTISQIETGMAELKMVTDPWVTNFAKLERSALSMAKNYGVAIQEVLEAMKVFGQQFEAG